MVYFIYYLLGINFLTFLFFAIDKSKAKSKKRRIPEKTLFFLMFVGGTIGGLLGMKYVRHKTQKSEFKQVVFLIISVQILIIGFILYGLYKN